MDMRSKGIRRANGDRPIDQRVGLPTLGGVSGMRSPGVTPGGDLPARGERSAGVRDHGGMFRAAMRRVRAALILALASGCPSSSAIHVDTAASKDAAPVDWHGRSIYFVVTDRFANGNPANDDAGGYRSNRGDPRAWHGGDLQGVIDRLDYIAGMGFTGIWITPVVEQHDGHAYHGYWGWEWSRIDGHLGDLGKLRELVDRAHARGIAVMIDTVANHTGRYDYRSPTFPDPAMYHHEGEIKNYNDPVEVETHDLAGLNDLAQENPVVRARLLDHVRWLVHA